MATDIESEEDIDEEGQPRRVHKEMRDTRIPKVDIVKGPASGRRFVVLKAQGAQPAEGIEVVRKAESATVNDLADEAFAYIAPGGAKDATGKTTPRSLRHFPIYDAELVRKSLSQASGSPFGDEAMPLIKAAAEKFGVELSDEAAVSKSQQEVPAVGTPTSEATAPPETGAEDELRIVAKRAGAPYLPEELESGVLKGAIDELGQPVVKAEGEQPTDEAPTDDAASPEATEAPVKKAAEEEEPGQLDAGEEIVVDGVGGASPDIPGSEGWENIDAATAEKWTAILGRAKLALQALADREGQEAATGAEDGDSAWDLEDAGAAIDYALGVLAKFAVDEAAEAALASEGGVIKSQEPVSADDRAWERMWAAARMQSGAFSSGLDRAGALRIVDGVPAELDVPVAVAKAMREFPEDALGTVEKLMPVKKAGRVLSASNEQSLRDALGAIQNVLNTLPQAPDDMTVAKAAETQEEPVVKATDTGVLMELYDAQRNSLGITDGGRLIVGLESLRVRKAKGDPMVAAYNANGELIGVVDPDDLVQVGAGTPAESKDGDGDGADDGTAPPDSTPAVVAPAAAPAAPATVPVQKAQESEKQPTEQIAEPLDLEAVVRKAMSEDVLKDHPVIKALREDIDRIGKRPARGGPLLNGLGTAGAPFEYAGDGMLALRSGARVKEPESMSVVRKQLDAESDPVQKAVLQQRLALESIKVLQGLE